MNYRISIIIGLITLYGALVDCFTEDFVGKNSIGKRKEYLDNNGKYLLEWEAYTDTKTIVFELTVATVGHVGFGISPVGGMSGADIIIGGIHPNGTIYFSGSFSFTFRSNVQGYRQRGDSVDRYFSRCLDRHGVGNRMPEVDNNEKWKLLEAFENATHTYLKVGRLWNTCGTQDVAIGKGTSNFIWSIGEDDDISYHGTNRGEFPFTFSFDRFKFTHKVEMPTKQTTYWCTVQKSPPLLTKHHIVGFRPILDTPAALKYSHHMIVHKCTAPAGTTDEQFFERFLNQPGDECYAESKILPSMADCQSFVFVWIIGGKTVWYIEHVGYPIGVDGKPTYYMLEVHYNNPENTKGVTVETGLEIFYTPQLRQYDAGILGVSRKTNWPLTIPPKSEEFTLTGQCSPSCTRNFPETGIYVFSTLLHAHLAGRKLKLRHFRDGSELPWLAVDDNYNFDFQQNRPLVKEIKILPGDHLTLECTYNSMQANGSIIGGLSTTDEMCKCYILYYPLTDVFKCGSDFPNMEFGERFGVHSTSLSPFNPTVLALRSMANKTFQEVLDTMTQWTKEFRDQYQHDTLYDNQIAYCGLGRSTEVMDDPIAYPKFSKAYAPVDECAHAHSTGNR